MGRLYARHPDPWRHLSSVYERAKHSRTLAAAGHGPFRFALEVGCGNGALARRLAPRCNSLLALDAEPLALAHARRRLAGHPGARAREGTVPAALPDEAPDLIVLSEVLYYLEPTDLAALAAWCRARAGGVRRIVAVSWLGPTRTPLGGAAALGRFRAGLERWAVRERRLPGYVIAVFQPPSVPRRRRRG